MFIVFCSWFRNVEKSVFSSFVVICSFHCLPFIGVAGSHYFDVDEDLTFHFIVDPDPDPAPHQSDGNLRPLVADPAFHFNVDPDPDPAPHHRDANLQPLIDNTRAPF